MNAADAFWWLAIPVVFLGLLVIGAAAYETLARRDWLRRLQRMESGRRAMGGGR
jgi:hypothetical protein